MNAISETFRILWLIFLWFGFSFMILVSLLSFIFGDWQWGALFLIMCPVFLAVIDMAHSESIVGKANGGPFHHFFIFVFFFGAVGLIVLTALTAFGVLRTADAMLWDPATNFASWYMVGGLLIVDFLIYRTDPNDDIPDLRRMEQLDRRSARVGVVSAAIFTVLCLVVPLTSFMTAGYDPVALAVALVRLELLPALFFAASVAMNGWSVKKYVTVGITIPEKEDDEAPKTTPVTG